MPKSKQSPALFELYSKGRTSGDAPEGAERTRADEFASGFRATVASVAKTISGAGGGGEQSQSEDGASPPTFALEHGRVRLALTSRGAGIAAFAVLLIVCVIFAAGKWFGRQSGLADGRVQAQRTIEHTAVNDIERARRSQPIEDLFTGIGASPVAGSETEKPAARVAPAPRVPLTATRTQPAGSTWTTGRTYVVVQVFRGDAREDAVRAQDYLARNDIASEIFGSSTRGFRLIASQGFDRDDAAQREQADRFLNKVRALGTAYFKSGGRYKLEGFFATLTSDAW